MKKLSTTNTFLEGLTMDINPLVTPNTVLTNCLNGTLLTYNGNENVLLNDMGNGKVGTAFLPEGYIPLGTAELGGIIYIVSYNPLAKKCLIGSFPSPERNISANENGLLQELNLGEFYNNEGLIKTPYIRKELTNKYLHIGDKFLIYSNDITNSITKGIISAVSESTEENLHPDKLPKYVKLNIVSIEDSGTTTKINDSLVWYKDSNNKYYYINTSTEPNNSPDEYRDLVSANYSVFPEAEGKLGILAELEAISAFDVSWDAKKNNKGNWEFYFYLNWEYDNDSAKDQINLYGIRVDTETEKRVLKISRYPSSAGVTDTNIAEKKDSVVFYSPKYVNNIDEDPEYDKEQDLTLRRNDGTDNPYLLYEAPYEVAENLDGILDLTIYPLMPYGALGYLKTNLSIDLDKLGTGAIDLKEYRYFYNEGNITLNWGLDAYSEKNKKINSVAFNFYDYSTKNEKENEEETPVKNWITKYSSYIDNNRIVNHKWEHNQPEDENSVELVGPRPITYPISLQSSYSGNFSENINLEDYGLKKNSLYLVEIVIDYNGEKTYKYYRFLYTSPIFNSYYFEKPDFSDISLQEAIEKYYPILYTTYNLDIAHDDSEQELYENGNKINIIDQYKEKDDTNNIVTFNISHEYDHNISFDIKGSLSINLFNIRTDITKVNEVDDISTSFDRQITTLIQSSSAVSEGGFLENTNPIVTASKPLVDSTNKISININSNFNDPFKVFYQEPTSLAVNYALEPLSIGYAWLLMDGGSVWAKIYVDDNYVNGNGHAGDNVNENNHDSKTIDKWSYCDKELKDRLKYYDIIAIKGLMHYTAASPMWTLWRGDNSKGDSDNARFKYKSDEDHIFLPMYAVLTDMDKVRLFTYSVYLEIIDSQSKYACFSIPTNSNREKLKWYGVDVEPPKEISHKGFLFEKDSNSSKGCYPIGLPESTGFDTLEKPLQLYRKVVNKPSTKLVLKWNKAIFYKNYNWITNFKINGECSITLCINEIELPSTTNYPKNLLYTPTRSFSLEESINGKESFDSYADKLISKDFEDVLINTEEGIKSFPGSKSILYTKDLEELPNLKFDPSLDGHNTTDGKSEILIQLSSDEHFIIKTKSISNSKFVTLYGDVDSLSIGVTEIINIGGKYGEKFK